MGRYFTEEESDKKTEVFNIDSDAIERAKKRSQYKTDKLHKTRNPYRKNDKKFMKYEPDKYPGKAPVDPKLIAKHSRGDGVEAKKVRTKLKQKEVQRREKEIEFANEIAARTEFLLSEDVGYLEGDETDEFTTNITQTQIKKAVDEESANKCFDLNLQQFGPYKIDYTRNGRHLLLGGRRGHVAAFDWQTKNLLCEINVMESVHDVHWLHTENMFAVAQKKWTYIYDNQGIEIHCLKTLDNVLNLEFLPYHFLLVAASDRGFLSWVDVSIGKMVAQFGTRMGRLDVMCQNPTNAVICLGHAKGVVSMWTPNMRDPVAKILCHKQPVRGVAVDHAGRYMATAGVDRTLKIWDVRTYKCLQDYKISGSASQLKFSGRGVLCASMGNAVELYKDCCIKPVEYPYMRHKVHKSVTDITFAPFEDVLGIGHAGGFSSILVPGCGEPNFDALEANPYQTKSQRKEAEVKALLEKISPDLITLDPTKLGEVDVPTLQDKIEEDKNKLYLKPSNIDFEPRDKTKGKGGTAKKFHVKRTVQAEERWRQVKKISVDEPREGKPKKVKKPKGLLDRLK